MWRELCELGWKRALQKMLKVYFVKTMLLVMFVCSLLISACALLIHDEKTKAVVVKVILALGKVVVGFIACCCTNKASL